MSLTLQFSHSAAPLKKVKKVQFGILSPEEVVSLVPSICYILLTAVFLLRSAIIVCVVSSFCLKEGYNI